MLHRFWITFEPSSDPSPLNLGCGVTAYDLDDAQRLLENHVFPVLGKRQMHTVIENVDMSALEKNHVQPNIGNHLIRGVWFPQM